VNKKFPASEKLKSVKRIEQLFNEGETMVKFPLKLYYLPLNSEKSTQAAFAAPKRNFSQAVDRNRIKRQMREAYRLHKHLLTSNNGKNFALLFLYISKDKPRYPSLEKSMRVLLKKIGDEVL
jgi:ribonuclease P protein component